MLKDYPPVLLKSKGLVEAWRNTLQAFDKFIEENIKGCFFHIKMKVMLRILHHLIEENKLSMYDEKIFEYFDNLMLYYNNTLKLFYDNEEKIKTGKAKEILEGICDVLSAQLRQFKESQLADQTIADEKSKINPIKAEKDNFLTEEKIDILNQLDDLEKQWASKKIKDYIISFREYLNILTEDEEKEIELIENIYSALIKDLKESLYIGYVRKSEKGIKKLNDFHLRKAANFYYESIKQEKENIEAIIKIQVKALEEEMEVENYEEEEEQIIQEILHTVREAYQHLGREIDELELFFKESEEDNKIVLFTSEEFEEYLNNQGLKSYINDIMVRKKLNLKVDEPDECLESFEVFNSNWEELKEEILKLYIEKINLDEFKEDINKKLQANIDLSTKVSRLFSDFITSYEKEKEKINEEAKYLAILDGIYETINIKIESINENIEAFAKTIEEVNSHIANETNLSYFEEEFIKLNIEIYNIFINEAVKEYSIEEEGFFNWAQEYLNKEYEEAFALFDNKVKNLLEKLYQEVNRKINKFLKEYLLFEVSTYEEIVNYSVSRLREETDDFVTEYVANIDKLTLCLEDTLKEYEIEFVEPVPHDMFNGREHEVLMAEVKEGFKKGEIIKTLNKGYRFNDQIILKANVVACK